MFSSKNFIVSMYTFKFMIYFELIFLCYFRQGSWFILLHLLYVGIWLKRLLLFPPLNDLDNLVEKSINYRYMD